MKIFDVFLIHAFLLIAFFFIVEVWKLEVWRFTLFKKAAGLLMFIGFIIDASFNFIWATTLFLQIPATVTFSERVKANKTIVIATSVNLFQRLIQLLQKWRKALATFICWVLLDRFVPGHCE